MKGKPVNCKHLTSMSDFCHIIPEGGIHAYFVSAKEADAPLVDGAEVSFDLKRHRSGIAAVNVHI